MTTRIYGIDLGTTYSCIAVVDEGRPRVLLNSEGKPTTPSVVYFESADNIVVGENAKGYAQIFPDRVVSTIKRAMGVDSFRFPCDGKEYTAQEISAFILRKCVRDAKAITGEDVTDVVITVPAYFGEKERAATKQAGQIAGLNVRYVVPEPTAAAIAYGMDHAEDQVILVYDLGGGTFDVTVIEVKNGDITVICTGGDHQLGGKDWDEAVVKFLAESFSEQEGIEVDRLLNDPETYQELMAGGESCKEKLSSLTKVVHRVQHDTKRVVTELTREKLRELTSGLLERTIQLTDELCATAAAKGYDRIGKILLVGGSTYMPQVMERLTQWRKDRGFEHVEIRSEDPNQIVACGAAVLGLKLAAEHEPADELSKQVGMTLDELKEVRDTKIVNVTSRSFGVVVVAPDGTDKVCNLITVDDPVPTAATHDFATVRENQTGATIMCIENRERIGSEELIAYEPDGLIGQADLSFDRHLPRGSPIEIRFALLDDGQLVVDARDLTTNGKVHATFQTNGVMSQDAVEEARRHHQGITIS